MITLDTIPVSDAEVIERPVENEAVLVLPSRGEVKVINEVGAFIWSLMDGARSVREIAAAIAREYEVELATAEQDALAFFSELLDRGVVTISGGEA